MEASQPVTRAQRVAFELDRFELVGDDRYEVEGRWFGVRGRRFIRPALVVLVDGRPTRFLADLAHKPWAAEDGEPWMAAFPGLDGAQEIEQAELTVAPDINIPLSGGKTGRASAPRKKTTSRAKAPAPRRAKSPPSANGSRASQALQQKLDRAEAETARVTARMDELLGELSQLKSERDESQATAAEAAAERDALQNELDQVAAERDALRTDRDQIAAERGDALAQRDDALAARDRARSEHDEACRAFAQAVSEHDGARAALAEAQADRNRALTARDDALAERDAAASERDTALARTESLARATERLQAELGDATTARGAALVMRRAAQEGPVRRADVGLLPRMIAVISLLAIAVVLLIILHVA